MFQVEEAPRYPNDEPIYVGVSPFFAAKSAYIVLSMLQNLGLVLFFAVLGFLCGSRIPSFLLAVGTFNFFYLACIFFLAPNISKQLSWRQGLTCAFIILAPLLLYFSGAIGEGIERARYDFCSTLMIFIESALSSLMILAKSRFRLTISGFILIFGLPVSVHCVLTALITNSPFL